jgi:hypothetical protein
VSNIVGILIILVMVAGIRAQSSSANVGDSPKISADSRTLADIESRYHELQTKGETALRLRMDVEDLQIQSEVVTEQLLLQSKEYAVLFDLMTSMRAGIELAAEEKSQTFKEKIEYQRRLQEINAAFEQIEKAKTYSRQTRPKATVLENIPTPLSRRVEGKEIHLRLLGGRVVYVPLDELIIQLRGHIGEEQSRYSKQKTNVGKVGPIDNFELEFLLATHDHGIYLQYAEAVPKWEPLGQPLRLALTSPQSDLCRKLSMFQKNLYTVTVWVYPDSFEEYQELKQFLHEQGYSVAARPLVTGSAIGISPYGTKSSTQ